MPITLLLSADLYQGPPVANITLDGVAMPPVTVTVLHGQPSQRTVLVAAPGPHTLIVAFANDAWGGTADTDRNLYLDGVAGVVETVPSHTFKSPDSLTLTVTVPVAVAPVVVPPVVATPPVVPPVAVPPAVTASDYAPKMDLIVSVLREILAQMKVAPIAAPVGGVTPVVPPTPVLPVPPSTAYALGWTALTLTPADNIGAAVAAAGKAFKLKLTPGRYKQVFHIPAGLDGWEIASSTGSAADVQLDGQGGLTVAQNSSGSGATRLAWGKGVVHASSAGTLRDLEITGGGLNANDGHDGQSGAYFDMGDAKGTTATLLRCMIRGNMNGVFGNEGNANFHLIFDTCDFDGNAADGGSHDCYVNGSGDSSLTVINCRALGSRFGNNFKTRLARVTMRGGFYASQNANRWVELADGGTIDIHGGIYIGNDIGQNVFGNGTETTRVGPGNTTWEGGDIYLGNRTANFANAGSFLATGVNVHANPGGGSAIMNDKGKPLVGLVIGPAAPAPAFPAFVSGAK